MLLDAAPASAAPRGPIWARQRCRQALCAGCSSTSEAHKMLPRVRNRTITCCAVNYSRKCAARLIVCRRFVAAGGYTQAMAAARRPGKETIVGTPSIFHAIRLVMRSRVNGVRRCRCGLVTATITSDTQQSPAGCNRMFASPAPVDNPPPAHDAAGRGCRRPIPHHNRRRHLLPDKFLGLEEANDFRNESGRSPWKRLAARDIHRATDGQTRHEPG